MWHNDVVYAAFIKISRCVRGGAERRCSYADVVAQDAVNQLDKTVPEVETQALPATALSTTLAVIAASFVNHSEAQSSTQRRV